MCKLAYYDHIEHKQGEGKMSKNLIESIKDNKFTEIHLADFIRENKHLLNIKSKSVLEHYIMEMEYDDLKVRAINMVATGDYTTKSLGV